MKNSASLYLKKVIFFIITFKIEKQREVERRLEETEKENRNRMMREREALMAKKREKELEIQALRRQKAIEQSVSWLNTMESFWFNFFF